MNPSATSAAVVRPRITGYPWRGLLHSVAIAAAVLASLPVDADAKWTQLRSEHFLFIGDASEGRIRATAQNLEHFREVLSQILPPDAVNANVPTVVVVFANDRSFTPFKPQYQGKTIEQIGGYFQAADDVNYITLNAESEELAFRIVFHEYTHFLVNNTDGRVPIWMNEGLAELYETFEERDGGRTALIGRAQAEHVLLLRDHPLIPLATLMSFDTSSPEYNEGNRRGMLYAESWALMHYMRLGNQQRSAQVRDYLARLHGGASPEQAFSDVFAADVQTLERELQAYVRRFLFPSMLYRFAEKVGGDVSARGEPLEDLEAEGYLGDLLAHIRRTDDARGRLQAVLQKDPRRARAIAALGAIEIRAEHLDDGIRLLEQAAALTPQEAGNQRALGKALIQRLDRERSDGAPYVDTLGRARAALSRALELTPDTPDVMALLAYTELLQGGDLNRSASLIRDAVRRAPTRDEYRLLLADVLMRQADYVQATPVLGLLVARAREPEVRDEARSRLAAVAERRVAASGDPRPPVAPRAESAGAPPESGRASPRFIPSLRQVKDGETRVLGAFESIECRQGAIMLQVHTSETTLHLHAAAFADVEFISYRAGAPGQVTCGPIAPPQRVLATYRSAVRDASPGSDGLVVAIEMIPDDYAPR